MADALERELSDRFSQIAAVSLIDEFGVDGAYRQLIALERAADEDSRQMYREIRSALRELAGK